MQRTDVLGVIWKREGGQAKSLFLWGRQWLTCTKVSEVGDKARWAGDKRSRWKKGTANIQLARSAKGRLCWPLQFSFKILTFIPKARRSQ